jgi:hypothetical protein
LFWPLVLIGAGVLLLLTNLGYVSWSSWNVLWRLWPLLLIGLGIDALIGRRTMGGMILSGLLILLLLGGAVALVIFARNIPGLADLNHAVQVQTRHIEHSLSDLERASVDIEWTSMPGYLDALHDSTNLIEGDISYRGELIFDVNVRGSTADVKLDRHFAGPWFGPFEFSGREENRWRVRLSPDVLLDLTLDTSSGQYELDLTELRISDLYLDVGSGRVDLALPAGSTFKGRINGGSGALDIALPRNVGARVALESGSGSFRPGERFHLVEGERHEDGVWETDNLRTAEYTIELEIDQGSGQIRFH